MIVLFSEHAAIACAARARFRQRTRAGTLNLDLVPESSFDSSLKMPMLEQQMQVHLYLLPASLCVLLASRHILYIWVTIAEIHSERQAHLNGAYVRIKGT